MSNNLDLTQVSEGMTNADVAINDKGGDIDAALTEIFTADCTAGDVTVTSAQYRRAAKLVATNVTVARQLILPAVKRFVIVENAAANTAKLTVKVGTTTIDLTHGQAAWFYTDGTANGLQQIGGGSSSAIEFIIGDGVNPVGTGIQGYIEVPFSCEITVGTLLADQTGSVVVDIYKCSYIDFAPGTHPVPADSITASAPLTISSAVKSQDSTLTGWTKTINAGEILAFAVNSAATITRVTVSLKVSK